MHTLLKCLGESYLGLSCVEVVDTGEVIVFHVPAESAQTHSNVHHWVGHAWYHFLGISQQRLWQLWEDSEVPPAVGKWVSRVSGEGREVGDITSVADLDCFVSLLNHSPENFFLLFPTHLLPSEKLSLKLVGLVLHAQQVESASCTVPERLSSSALWRSGAHHHLSHPLSLPSFQTCQRRLGRLFALLSTVCFI